MSEEHTLPLEVAAGILSGKYAITSVYVLTTRIEAVTRERDEARAEVERLRADAERFRWLAAQTRMQIVTDGTVWHHGGGRESFVGWGYMFVNDRGYPAAPSLAELVDLARSDQGNRGTRLTEGENR